MLGLTVHRKKSFEDTITDTTEALKKEGFGVLTTIDVKNTLKEKIGVDFKRYTILGACNPGFAHKALQTADEIGLLLPCNVVVTEEKNGETKVSIFDPMTMTKLVQNPELEKIAKEVQEKLIQVIHHLHE
ncbi:MULTISPECIES: DUF302 domain-containing protein [Leptospira]|uniref:DUF302 domain-containing protein n=2 Tax=Leptospira TaxID=171 RepID=A0AAW5VKD1_9LEPT|nr:MULTISPECIES: DUF302 domain-containing protein [Leptospira]PKA24030.1 ABC transporter ATP-binding protein [Leptospira sp. mixed culture ATI2-C-A1]MCW7492431.1 DUF302 domain-containing protein [Leptospira soteropolitanensis]MCW7500482.1 DUF302 domain-containing protein [Leptospira soteropolitanensis]MCW7522848.1 DUF302 domain-containing protein [Leptospira soteropolitanensis]MCW7526707.1 DUF302 domain-containing protein [Leptospira soteropolitanensis]